jgi:tetratricopeptide (TPR) repeat protein
MNLNKPVCLKRVWLTGLIARSGFCAWVAHAVYIGLSLILFSGCGSAEFKKGNKSLEKGQYEQAVRYFEESVEKAKPKKIRKPARQLAHDYRRAGILTGKKGLDEKVKMLAKALQAAAQWNLKQARNAKAKAQMSKAVGLLNRALSYIPDKQDAKDLLQEVRQAIEHAQQLQRAALNQAASEKWDDALNTIKEALTVDATLAGGSDALKRIQRGGYDSYCAQAKQALDRDTRTDVRKHITHARQFSDGPEASAMWQTVKNRDEADQLVKTGIRDFNAARFTRALDRFVRAQALYPTLPGLIIRIQTTKEHICDDFMAQANQYLESGKLYKALRQFLQSQDLLPLYGDIDLSIAQTRQRIAAHHLSRAQEYMQKALPGNAVLHQVICLNYEPQNTAARQALRSSTTLIKKETEYAIGFVGLTSVDKNREVADRIEASALQHLNRAKPMNVSVVDRMDLKSVLDEQSLMLTDLVDPSLGPVRGRLTGVKALFVGKLLENNVGTRSTSTYGKASYQAGTKTVVNPKYTEALDGFDKANGKLQRSYQARMSAQQDRDVAQSIYDSDPSQINQGSLNQRRQLYNEARSAYDQQKQRAAKAQRTVNITPPQIEEPVMKEHRYPIYQRTKTAIITCLVKLIDTETSAVLFTDQVKGEFSQSDRHVEPDAPHNVTEDPLDLPDDVAMRNQALEVLLAKLRRSIELASRKHGHRFILMMRQAEKDANFDEVIENSMKYLFAYPIAPGNTDRLMQALEKAVSAPSDQVNITQLLRSHCGLFRGRAGLPAQLQERDGKLWIQKGRGRVNLNVSLPCELIAVEGESVNSMSDVQAVLSPFGTGDEVTITVLSKSRNVTKSVKLVAEESQ